MNLSGKSIKQCSDFYKIKPENIIVIYDDIDIEKGIVKVRKAGGAGTHNGMKSVVECLGTQKFPRVRVGIGMPDHKNDLINYVIGNVPKEEKIILDKGCEIAKYAVKEILKNGIDNAMNKIN
jgi:PTH1 family peptidyl-tRNA hydrolase